MNESLTVIIITCMVLSVLEYLYPARKYSKSRELKENMLWFIFRELLFNLTFGFFVLKLSLYLANSSLISPIKINLNNYSVWLQIFIVVVAFDFSSYLIHFLFHRYNLLYTLHVHHHTSTELTATSSFRQSPYEQLTYGIYFSFLTNCFYTQEIVTIISSTLFIVICLIQHCNIRLPRIPLLIFFIISPHNHLWHHSKNKFKSHGQNFGFIFTIWDRIFGTFYIEQEEPKELGLKYPIKSMNFISLYFFPFRIGKRSTSDELSD